MKKPKITKEIIKSAFEKATEIVKNPRTTLNRQLMRETAKAIETEALAGYDQGAYANVEINGVCKTTCCIMGQGALLSGFTFAELMVLANEEIPNELEDYRMAELRKFRVVSRHHGYATEEVGAALFGLTQEQTQHLFTGDPSDYWNEPYADTFEDAPQATAAKYLRAIASGKVKL